MLNKFVNTLSLHQYLGIKHSLFYMLRFLKPSFYRRHETAKSSTAPDKNSYKPFIETKSIFIHIPKCAGVSLKVSLYGRGHIGGHNTLSKYSYIFSPHEIENYFKFTIVRNPYDRLVSAFFFLKKGGINQADADWAKRNLSVYTDFKSFVTHWLTHKNIYSYDHFKPQHHYFIDRHKSLKVNYFAFFENIESDFLHIANATGNVYPLEAYNSSNHFDYMSYYDDELIEIVSDVYKEDLNLLEYDFDNSSLNNQIKKRNEFPDFPYLNIKANFL